MHGGCFGLDTRADRRNAMDCNGVLSEYGKLCP